MRRFLVVATICFACVGFSAIARADDFGTGANSFSIRFVKIGDADNPADHSGSPNPAGAVPYEYRIGKFEISESMIERANALGGLGITKDTRGPNKPATSIDWFEAAKFVNWLNTSRGHVPAYKFVPVDRFSPPEIVASRGFVLWEPGDEGYDATNRYRNRLAKYFLPSADEWYKAAYFDPASGTYFDYPTGSNLPPLAVAGGTSPGTAVYQQDLASGPANIMFAGGLSPFGTMAQGGNVDEWEETALDLTNNNAIEQRGRRGGGWEFSSLSSTTRFAWGPSNAVSSTGFRVAAVVPETDTVILILVGSMLILVFRRFHPFS